ncbi:MAG: hypothetical protein KGZ72_06200 [Roseovarius sp.]|jgi:integrase|nr:hypothetical protein [Roseovarius sp.]
MNFDSAIKKSKNPIRNSDFSKSTQIGRNTAFQQMLKTLRSVWIQTSHRGKIHIQPDAILRAYQTARLAEIVSPAACRSRHGTMWQYKSALNTLRRMHSSESQIQTNPFYSFMHFDFSSRKKGTFYKYKAALQAYAIDLLLENGEAVIVQFWDDTFVHDLGANKQALAEETERRLGLIYRALNGDGSVELQVEQLAKSDLKRKAVYLRQTPHALEQIISAAAYLTAFPPLLKERTEHILARKGTREPNLQELQIKNRGLTVFDIAEGFYPEIEWSPKGSQDVAIRRGRFSKRQLIARLNGLDKLRGDGRDWREHFFHSLEKTFERGRNDKKRQVAIFTLTGCRPSEMAMGIRIYLEDNGTVGATVKPVYYLVFRVLGSKCTVLAHDEEIAIFDKMSAAEKVFKRDIYGDPAHQKNQERGHEWRIIRVMSDAPEAAFLANHILENGEVIDTDLSRDPSLLDTEKVAIKELIRNRLTHVTTVHPSGIDKALLALAEDHTLPEEQVNKQAHNISAWVSYHAGKLYPRLRDVVTPYAWRHQFASDLKAFADNPELFARALGQRSQKTQAHYGHSSSSITKKFGHISIRTSQVVRDNYQHHASIRIRADDNHKMT